MNFIKSTDHINTILNPELISFCVMLCCRDESLSGSELTSKLEPAFLAGLRCNQAPIRHKFVEVFDSSMKKRLFDRLLYITCSQNWEAMGGHFWIKQCIEVSTLRLSGLGGKQCIEVSTLRLSGFGGKQCIEVSTLHLSGFGGKQCIEVSTLRLSGLGYKQCIEVSTLRLFGLGGKHFRNEILNQFSWFAIFIWTLISTFDEPQWKLTKVHIRE